MHQPAPTSFVLRPVVTVVLVYVVLVAIWGLWTLTTARFPTIESGGALLLLTRTQFVIATLVHAALCAALVIDGLLARRSGPGLRRGHVAGVVLSLLVLAVLQWGAILAQRPISAP